MSRTRVFAAFVVFGALVLATTLFACSETPTASPIRTFERAQKVDVICLRVFGDDAPEPLRQEECAPVPPNVNGASLQNQLFALVTQTSRGEIAVVDLSAGFIIDQSHPIPGLNFLPVGALPTDIATTPDGRMAFVASAEPNKFAIYGIPGHRILGDQAGRVDPDGPITLASWPVCALPQRPGALAVVARAPASVVTPGEAEPDAGSGSSAPDDVGYDLVVVLPGDRSNPAKIVTMDPRPFLRATPRRFGKENNAEDFGAGPALTPGTLEPCPITAAIELVGEDAVPPTFRVGTPWDDGVKWVDGGVDLSCAIPEPAKQCGPRPCKCAPPSPVDEGADADGGSELPPVECIDEPADPVAAEIDFELGPLDPPQPVAVAHDGQMLYVADDGVPLIHVIDLSTPGQPRELPPFVVSSLVDPSRTVGVRDLALSPPTRDYKRYLYAVDRKDGSIAIFDVTDPLTAERVPMRRPHAELNPFQPPDRIAFTAPVVSVAFARNDFPLTRIDGRAISNAKTGVLCNPNPNVDAQKSNPESEAEFGARYRANSSDVDIGIGPGRLRGIFAFATLSNGQVVTIDVDDWDAPCRRPDILSGAAGDPNTPVGALAAPQPAPGPSDFDPYHAPEAPLGSVTGEFFVPVSAPHRPRSMHLLRDSTSTGRHIPFLSSIPSLTSVGASAPPLFGPGSEVTPRLRPTAVRPGVFTGTELINVRFSDDVPEVHFNQDWAVTYEGRLPGFDGLPATISTTDNYSSLILSQPQARFCAKGVEDWAVGGERANAIVNALAAAGREPYPERLDRRMVDYVRVLDELLPASDPFWSQPDAPEPNGCWDERLNPSDLTDERQVASVAHARFDVCANYFGAAGDGRSERDFPILEAYDDRLVIGRFATLPPNESREVVYSDPSNATALKLMRCCFHHQVRFDIRAGSQWVTVGSGVGLLSNVVRGEGGRCVPSCDSRDALLNSRAPSLPFGQSPFAPHRDSPLAMRNPAFSFFVQNGHRDFVDVLPERDMSYRFQTLGQFEPLVLNLAATTTSVNPQSMRFIEPLGQLAVVDGASTGLVLIDLAGVTIARASYF